MASIVDIDPWEDKHAIPYLDHSPVKSALYTIDRDLSRTIDSNAYHLSAAWAVLAPDQYEVDIRWVKQKEPQPRTENGAIGAWVRGQRVLVYRPPSTYPEHACAVWTRSLGGNYWWLWQNTMELLAVWKQVMGHAHGMTPFVHTLEVMPPVLLETSGERTEPPVTMQAEYHVHTPDGLFVEAVDSWRNYYIKRRQALLSWSKRPVPAWAARGADGKWGLVRE